MDKSDPKISYVQTASSPKLPSYKRITNYGPSELQGKARADLTYVSPLSASDITH